MQTLYPFTLLFGATLYCLGNDNSAVTQALLTLLCWMKLNSSQRCLHSPNIPHIIQRSFAQLLAEEKNTTQLDCRNRHQSWIWRTKCLLELLEFQTNGLNTVKLWRLLSGLSPGLVGIVSRSPLKGKTAGSIKFKCQGIVIQSSAFFKILSL